MASMASMASVARVCMFTRELVLLKLGDFGHLARRVLVALLLKLAYVFIPSAGVTNGGSSVSENVTHL